MRQENQPGSPVALPQIRPKVLNMPARPTLGKWRAAALASVYALFVVHFIHWKLAGKTLAPLEFNEVAFTFELGVVTAGFLFMAAALLSVLIFGRFFCAWGCHILALQDLCTWLLRKIGIRAKPFRSRFLVFIPLAVLLYMFAWPFLKRWIVYLWPDAAATVGTPRSFDVRILGDAEGWASFVTTDFWRNLPGPGLTILTFLVCGFAVVYLLGSRSFCTYVCPYGAAFGLVDRLAPGRIRLTGDCNQCARCTVACPSNLPVHEEIDRYGMVVSPGCFKDLDCIRVCPQNAISFGFGKPSLLADGQGKASPRRRSVSLAEEVGLLGVFVVVLAIFTGFPQSIAPWAGRLYGFMPLFLSATLAVVTGFIVIYLWRYLRRSYLSFQRMDLKSKGRVRPAGAVFLGLSTVWLLFVAHSGLVQYHMFQAGRDVGLTRRIAPAVLRQDKVVLDQLDPDLREALVDGERHLQRAEALGLFADIRISWRLAWFALVRGDSVGAERLLREAIALEPGHPDPLYQLGLILAVDGHFDDAAGMFAKADELSRAGDRLRGALRMGPAQLLALGLREQGTHVLEQAILLAPDDVGLLEDLSRTLIEGGRSEAAIVPLRQLLQLRPEHHAARIQLAQLLLESGFTEQAAAELRRVLATQPDHARANAILGRTLLWMLRRPQEAIPHLEKAVAGAGGDPDIRSDLATAYLEIKAFEKAEVQIRANLENPDTEAGSLYMLGELRRAQGRHDEAKEFFLQAKALNPRFSIPDE